MSLYYYDYPKTFPSYTFGSRHATETAWQCAWRLFKVFLVFFDIGLAIWSNLSVGWRVLDLLCAMLFIIGMVIDWEWYKRSTGVYPPK